jgi:hypothetical protein
MLYLQIQSQTQTIPQDLFSDANLEIHLIELKEGRVMFIVARKS